MFRQYSGPRRCDYDTEAEYNEALDAWDNEQVLRTDYLYTKKNIQPLNIPIR